MHKYKRGFTLAEVLITLLIIGVVSSLVIPALIQDSQEAEFHTAWKKAYSDFEQATRQIILNNAGSIKGICTNADAPDCLKNLYMPYLNVSKVCYNGLLIGNCWHNTFYNYNKVPITTFANRSGVILSNGTLVRFEGNGFPGCTNNTWVGSIPKCAFINVDINGFKGPNTLGKDIYFMILTESKLLPVGTQGGGFDNDCSSGGLGYGCAAKYLYQY